MATLHRIGEKGKEPLSIFIFRDYGQSHIPSGRNVTDGAWEFNT